MNNLPDRSEKNEVKIDAKRNQQSVNLA